MNKFIKCSFILSVFALLISCNSSKKTGQTSDNRTLPIMDLDTLMAVAEAPVAEYRASSTRLNDLLHTRLEVKFDWKKCYLYGKAQIKAKPYFYPVKELVLDAKGMDISKVALVEKDEKKELIYDYKDNVLKIQLNKEYTRDQTYEVYIEYTSKPNELKSGGSAAITEDKGLYFINPDGSEKDKPKQIWTQGETEANSAWFPTIDKPNERMTTEIFITIEKNFNTLSNGELIYQKDNGDSTRTDCWKMDLPIAPYLVMMSIGEYAIVKDKWRGKEVNYYVEKEYEPYARDIFGNTPEMLEFYSTRLGVDYPWNKYSQVVVRDYVSGAMENTTAVIHGEFLQQTKREMLDDNNEDVIAHELFHHWFGDYVTCESWSNLTLNESFATYGEYLWNEYKYGREMADFGNRRSQRGYFGQAQSVKHNLVHFYYNESEDMFDGHSYNKGGAILHMLRKTVGDDAFFTALKLYLETNKFKSAEAHQLRLVFEEVTGQDLNWFFNQWYYSSGHPELIVHNEYDDSSKKAIIYVRQVQDLKSTPLFKIPVDVDITVNGKTERHRITISKASEQFDFAVSEKPALVNFDAENMILGDVSETKTDEEWAYQYYNGSLYYDRSQAINELINAGEDTLLVKKVVLAAYKDKNWHIRELAIKKSERLIKGNEADFMNALIARTADEKANIRTDAIASLAAWFDKAELVDVYKKAVNDSSYAVIGEALMGIAKTDQKAALAAAKPYENETSDAILSYVANIYGEYGKDEQLDFFLNSGSKFKGYAKLSYISSFSTYLFHADNEEIVNKGLPMLEDFSLNGKTKYVKFYAQRGIKNLLEKYIVLEETQQLELNNLKKKEPSSPNISDLEKKLEVTKLQKEKLTKMAEKATEAR